MSQYLDIVVYQKASSQKREVIGLPVILPTGSLGKVTKRK